MKRRLDRAAIALLAAGALGAVLAVIRVAGRLMDNCRSPLPHCWLHQVLGVPCPFCGGTRSLAALAAGHLGAALAWNPLVAAAAMAVLAGPVIALLAPDRGLALSARLRAPALLRGALALNWCYLLAHHRI